jgi:hypothetical protein
VWVSKKLESGLVGANVASPTGCFNSAFGGYMGSGTRKESLLKSIWCILNIRARLSNLQVSDAYNSVQLLVHTTGDNFMTSI